MNQKLRLVQFFPSKWFFLTIFVFLCAIEENKAAYKPPSATVQPIHPRGIRLSVPHEDGITLVAFHVKINEDFTTLEAGTISVDVIKARNGLWTYEDRTTRLKLGDTVYYWVHVVYDGLGYNLLDQNHVVTEFYNWDGTPVSTSGTEGTACTTPSETQIIKKGNERQNACAGQVLLDENFNQLNTSRWSTEERFSCAPDYEFVVYMNNNEVIDVKDGNLHIKPILVDAKYGEGYVRRGSLVLDKCTSKLGSQNCRRDAIGAYVLPPVISGRLNTRQSFKFLYGRIEVRAKLPRGDWLYPMITLENTEEHTQNVSTYTEIRIACAVGNPVLTSFEGSNLSGHVLSAGGLMITLHQNEVQHTNRMNIPTKISNELWSNDYHTYEIEWRRGRITAKVDGMSYGEQSLPATFDKPYYLNVGVGVGGRGEFPDMSQSGTYAKPWRNIASKATFKFYLARDSWLQSWTNADTGLHVDYIKVSAL